MPQLDITTFVSQYLWLVIILGLSYYHAYNNKTLAEIMKLRKRSGSN